MHYITFTYYLVVTVVRSSGMTMCLNKKITSLYIKMKVNENSNF